MSSVNAGAVVREVLPRDCVAAADAAAPRALAVRIPGGYYSVNDLDKLAVDRSVLDRPYSDFAYSSTWIDPACRYCFLPQFRRLFPRKFQRCPSHGVELPAEDPFPWSERERVECEERVWEPFAEQWSIPERYRDVRLETSAPIPAIVAVRNFLDADANATRCLIAAGPTGVGKTQAAVAGLRREAVWHQKPSRCAFFTMATLARGFIREDSDEILDRAIKADLLLIDDVGASYMKNGGVAETLFEELIVTREAQESQTILTTNLTAEQFREAFGDRVADRIRGEWGVWRSLPGASLRHKPKRPERPA